MGGGLIGGQVPVPVTLAELTALNTADQLGRRYELSPEGVLSVMAPPDSEHAVIASRVMIWLAKAGWPAEQVLQAVGVRTGENGGRIPDLTLLAEPQPKADFLRPEGLLLVVEIVSPTSEAMDKVVKRHEYAAVGIPRYWVIHRDPDQTVTLYVLDGGKYTVEATGELDWVLGGSPETYFSTS